MCFDLKSFYVKRATRFLTDDAVQSTSVKPGRCSRTKKEEEEKLLTGLTETSWQNMEMRSCLVIASQDSISQDFFK